MKSDAPKLMQKFKCWTKPPESLKDRLNSTYMNRLRENVHTTAMMNRDGKPTGVNYILRNQQAHLAMLIQGSSLCSASPRTSLPYNALPNIDTFADGTEILLNRLAEMGSMTPVIEGLLQESMTVPTAWMKLNWIEDGEKDPLGNAHFDAIDALQGKRVALDERMSAGEFDKESAEYEELQDVKKSIRILRARAINRDIAITPLERPRVSQNSLSGESELVLDPRTTELEGLEDGSVTPNAKEIPHFKGFAFEPKYAETIGFDWSITRPEQLYDAAWIYQTVQMTRDEVIARFGITGDDLEHLGGKRTSEKHSDNNDANKPKVIDDDDHDTMDEDITVFEFWYKETRTVYYFCDKYPTWLGSEVPEATWEKWYPFFLLQLNRVSGMLMGRSPTELQWALQERYNELKLHDGEALNASYPRYIVGTGLFEEDELDKLKDSMPFDIIEMNRADQIKEGIHEIQPVQYDANKYGTGLQRTRVDMEAMMGLPSSGLGSVGGAELATEVAFASKHLEAQSNRFTMIIERMLVDIFNAMAEIAYQTLSDEEIMVIVGEGFQIPQDRMRYLSAIELRASVNGRPDSEKIIGFVTNFINISAALGRPVNADQLLILLLDSSDLRIDPSKILPPLPPQPVIPTSVESGGSQGGQASNGGTPEPEQIPGSAQTVGAGGI